MKAEHKCYENLTARQKSLINAIAIKKVEDKEWTRAETVEAAHEMSGEKQYHPEYVSDFLDKYEHIIKERIQILSNVEEGEEGDVITVGDPMRQYTGPPEGLDSTMQNIQDRPVKSTSDDNSDKMVLLPVDEDILFKMIRSEDEEVARFVFDQVMEEGDT